MEVTIEEERRRILLLALNLPETKGYRRHYEGFGDGTHSEAEFLHFSCETHKWLRVSKSFGCQECIYVRLIPTEELAELLEQKEAIETQINKLCS